MLKADLSVARMEKRRQAIFETVFLPVLHSTMGGSDLSDLAALVMPILGGKVRQDVLMETLRPAAGHEFHADAAWKLAWRLAANVHLMQAGRPAVAWQCQHASEAIMWQFVSGRPQLMYNGKPGIRFRITALLGSPAGETFVWHVSVATCRMVAMRIGFTRNTRDAKFPLRDPIELVGLRFLGQSEPNDRGSPAPSKLLTNQAAVKWNREHVLSFRSRLQPCPQTFLHPCHLCAVGARRCAGAVHAETFVLDLCPACGNPQALFDPEIGREKCRDCALRAHYRDHVKVRR